ncbi:MAG: AAA family ATPase [Candidatus Spechtbacterales bacterium]|nr:AAA family ATPase [Candidatus Spechtbacterales bacterium]
MSGEELIFADSEPEPREFTKTVPKDLSPFWRNMSQKVSRAVVGQERAVRKTIRNLSILESPARNNRRAVPALLFVGPSASGKTLLAEVIAREWLGIAENENDEQATSPLVVIDGENYSQRHEGSTLKGAPPGYVGQDTPSPFEEIGKFDRENREKAFFDALAIFWKKYEDHLLESDRLSHLMDDYFETKLESYLDSFRPFRSVLLIDEWEKMHPVVQKQFLKILDKGTFQTHHGKKINFRRTLIILTSNIGTEKIAKILDNNTVGFDLSPSTDEISKQEISQDIYREVEKEVRRKLDPALYSRIGHDGIVVFNRLTKEDYEKIVNREIEYLQERFFPDQSNAEVIFIYTTKEFRDMILDKSDVEREGARQINRLISKYMENPLANAFDGGYILSGDQVLFDAVDGEAVMRRKPRSANFKILPAEIIDRDNSSAAPRSEDKTTQEFLEEFEHYMEQALKALLERDSHPRPPKHLKDDDPPDSDDPPEES